MVFLSKAPVHPHFGTDAEDRAWIKTAPHACFKAMAFALMHDQLNDVRKGIETP